LAVVDLIAAYALITKDFHILGIAIAISIILFCKGVPSLFSDILSKIYGAVDIIVALIILFSVVVFPIDVVLFFIMLYKGIISLL